MEPKELQLLESIDSTDTSKEHVEVDMGSSTSLGRLKEPELSVMIMDIRIDYLMGLAS